MLTLICPACGKESNRSEFVSNICKYCYYKNNPILTLNTKDILLCKGCARIKSGPMWEQFSEDSFVERIMPHIKTTVDNCEIKSIEPVFFKNKIRIDVDVNVAKGDIQKQINILLSPKYQYCSDCSKKTSGFFQSIVQLRGFENTVAVKNQFLSMLKKATKDEIKEGNFLAYLEKIDEVSTGIDFYLGSKNLALAFIREIKEHYAVEQKFSTKLIGLVNNKKKVRNTFLVRKKSDLRR